MSLFLWLLMVPFHITLHQWHHSVLAPIWHECRSHVSASPAACCAQCLWFQLHISPAHHVAQIILSLLSLFKSTDSRKDIDCIKFIDCTISEPSYPSEETTKTFCNGRCTPLVTTMLFIKYAGRNGKCWFFQCNTHAGFLMVQL